ncbi:hypothetical protein Acsp03_69570 [Actinomadura sp. NBRC 104412]|uniref:hypothetical protein n=1 Tax=Actinomadura sp. NBRC 104412 TaxID=3032203 RepID=UPI0024A2481B|nr:hypothetical protein [Actinomadura sp. NBRC 104412]GLZ09491.1 hypothetical protein Acsp03_69570 [Actinomadura sp. NBRC 104412]
MTKGADWGWASGVTLGLFMSAAVMPATASTPTMPPERTVEPVAPGWCSRPWMVQSWAARYLQVAGDG